MKRLCSTTGCRASLRLHLAAVQGADLRAGLMLPALCLFMSRQWLCHRVYRLTLCYTHKNHASAKRCSPGKVAPSACLSSEAVLGGVPVSQPTWRSGSTLSKLGLFAFLQKPTPQGLQTGSSRGHGGIQPRHSHMAAGMPLARGGQCYPFHMTEFASDGRRHQKLAGVSGCGQQKQHEHTE